MKFKDDWFGKMKTGIVFSLFMLVVMLLFMVIILPLILIPTLGIIISGGSTIFSYIGAVLSIFIILLGFIAVGWGVQYFYRKHTFVYRRKK